MKRVGWLAVAAILAGILMLPDVGNGARIAGWLFGLLLGILIGEAYDEIRTRRRAAAEDADAIDIVAQAIARCYGHGPLDRMDPAYQREFRRDARAAIAAMRRRT